MVQTPNIDDGGESRRGMKILGRKACGFKSRPGHHCLSGAASVQSCHELR